MKARRARVRVFGSERHVTDAHGVIVARFFRWAWTCPCCIGGDIARSQAEAVHEAQYHAVTVHGPQPAWRRILGIRR